MNKTIKNFLVEDEWKFCVKNLPIIAIDLIIKNKKSEILMGIRSNNPAKDFFFVPGGRIFKNEKVANAFERISLIELGKSLKINDAKFLNYYEHFYQNSLWNSKDISTHYLVLAFEYNSTINDKFNLNKQHKSFKWVSKKNKNDLNIHEYALNYLDI